MSETYSVVVSGQLVEGFELDQVKQSIVGVFKLSPAQVDKLMCGKPVALKRGIEKSKAVKLSQRLQELGAVSIIKAAAAAKKPTVNQAQPTATAKPEPKPKPKQAAPAAAPVEAEISSSAQPAVEASTKNNAQRHNESLDCPRCGHSQPVSDSCQLCKMDLTAHLRRTERRARVVANILKERKANTN